MFNDVTAQVVPGMVCRSARPTFDHLTQRPPLCSAGTRERARSRWRAETGSAPGHPADFFYLAGTPWSMRAAIGADGRSALEVYAAGSLIDVMLAPSLGSQLLRGACTTVRAGRHHSMAWGCLPAAGGTIPFVEFVPGGFHHRPQIEAAEDVSAWFWVATAAGRFSRVTATSQTERVSCRSQRMETC
jgi:hypothetical protein